MSRYQVDIQNGEMWVAYGLDHALGWFADIFAYNPEKDEEDIVESAYGRTQVFELFEKYDVEKELNEWHIKSIAMDLPIADNEEEFNKFVNQVLGGTS
tara:strand:+ start:637 stop:930 length:294 start_codon:yes stop_codon:yes gene_type:complete